LERQPEEARLVVKAVLYSSRTSITGRALADHLGAVRLRDTRVRRTTAPNVLIRWGASTPPLSAEYEFNKADAIRSVANKITFGDRYGGPQYGYSVLPIYLDHSDALSRNEHGIVLGRRRYGFGGAGICAYMEEGVIEWYMSYLSDMGRARLVDNQIEFNGRLFPAFTMDMLGQFDHDFYVPYVKPRFELRVYTVGGEIVHVKKKYLEHPNNRMYTWIQNHKQGYVFKTPREIPDPDILDNIAKLTTFVGLDFGAVDVLRDVSGNYHVLEINSAPGLAPEMLQKFADAIDLHVRRCVDV
jgi:hypothetical protein